MMEVERRELDSNDTAATARELLGGAVGLRYSVRTLLPGTDNVQAGRLPHRGSEKQDTLGRGLFWGMAMYPNVCQSKAVMPVASSPSRPRIYHRRSYGWVAEGCSANTMPVFECRSALDRAVGEEGCWMGHYRFIPIPHGP